MYFMFVDYFTDNSLDVASKQRENGKKYLYSESERKKYGQIIRKDRLGMGDRESHRSIYLTIFSVLMADRDVSKPYQKGKKTANRQNVIYCLNFWIRSPFI